MLFKNVLIILYIKYWSYFFLLKFNRPIDKKIVCNKVKKLKHPTAYEISMLQKHEIVT